MAEPAPEAEATNDRDSVISEDSDDAPLSALIVRKPSVEEREERERGVSLVEERFLADALEGESSETFDQKPHEVTPEDTFAQPLVPRDENNKTPPSPGQRFLRPSELFAQDNRASVRAEHPGDLDRAVRNRLSEMWRAVDESTRKSYVERARKVRERARSESQEDVPEEKATKKRSPPKKKKPPRPVLSKPPSAAAGLGPGQPVCCANDPQRRGVVVKQTAGSWLLVRFARGGETKARPSQLRALRTDEALTDKEKEELAKPFDPVRDVQDAVDADVRVAAADGGFVANVFIDRDGTERRQFEAYALPGGGVGARCGVCGLDQVLPESAVSDGGRGKVVHALKSHCGYYAACSMSASNAHIAALQELVAEPLRRGMPGDTDRPTTKPRSGSTKSEDGETRPRKRPAAAAASLALQGASQGRDRSGSANRCGTCVNCRSKKGRACLENPEDLPLVKKRPSATKRPVPRKKLAPQAAFLASQRGYESDESSTLGWVVDVPPWDPAEALLLEARDASLDRNQNDFHKRVYEPSQAPSLDICAEHARSRIADDDACACALNKETDPVKAGQLCKDALDSLAKRRNGVNGPGALELRWALGARGALSPKDREKAVALLDENEGRGLEACPREVARGLSRPLGDVLAWYYAAREPDDSEEARAKDAWLGGRRRQVVDGPQRAHLNLNQLNNVADAKDDVDALLRRPLDAPGIGDEPVFVEVPSLVEGKARPPPLTKFLKGEVDVGQRSWVVGSTSANVASERRLDLVQLEHAQGTFVEGTSSSVLLPTLPALPAPSPPSARAVERRLKCKGGEVLEVGSTKHGARLWYAPRAYETWRDVAHKLKGLHLAAPSFFPTTGTRRDLSAAALAGFGSCAISAPRCAYREDTLQTDPAAAEELWAAQLAFCGPGEAFASRPFSGDDRIIRSLPEKTSERERPLILLPLRTGWPRIDASLKRGGVTATRKASSDSEDEPDVDGKRGDTSFSARRARVCCIVPPSLAKFRGDLEEESDRADLLKDGDRLWAKLPRGKGAPPPPRRPRVASDGEPRTRPVTLDARSVATAAVTLGCDPVSLERRNRASPGAFSGGQYAHETERSLGHGLLLLGANGSALRGPCAQCRVQGEQRGFRCRAIRRHEAPEAHLPPIGGWQVGSRVRCRWADEDDQRTVTWFYATVTEVVSTEDDKATLKVLYDDYAPDDEAGQDQIEVPDEDTVTCGSQPRVLTSEDDKLRIGKTFVWSRNSPREKREPGRWKITQVYDSLEEGVDGIMCTYARVERRREVDESSDDDELKRAPTRAEELDQLVKHARWDDTAPPPAPKPLKRKKENGSPVAKKKRKTSDEAPADKSPEDETFNTDAAPTDLEGVKIVTDDAVKMEADEPAVEPPQPPPEPAPPVEEAQQVEPMAIGA